MPRRKSASYIDASSRLLAEPRCDVGARSTSYEIDALLDSLLKQA